MAAINLSNEKISSLSTEIESLDSTLLNSYIPELNSVIDEIKSNILNDQVNQILGTISSQVETIAGELKTDLPKLEQFLDNQMTKYESTEAEAEEKVNAVLEKMQAFAGVSQLSAQNRQTSFSTGNSSSSSTNTATKTESSNTSESSHNIYGRMASGALAGAGIGFTITGFSPGGALAGGICGGLSPVVADVGGKVMQGAGWLLEKWAGDW